jgi:hypothetical protein
VDRAVRYHAGDVGRNCAVLNRPLISPLGLPLVLELREHRDEDDYQQEQDG